MSSNILPRSATKNAAAILLALCTSALMVACGGGDSVVYTTRYTIGGAASGLVGTGLVLQDNSGDNLTVSASGSFTFATPLTNGSSYSVGVATQPTDPSQNCVVTDGAGTVSGAHVTSVVVTCSTNGFTVGGSVSGLSGGGLVLQDNGGDDLPITAAGNFTFSQTIGSGVAYAVSVKTQPTSNPSQTCVVTNPTGTVAAANVTNVAVACTTNTYTVGGSITGLSGTGLVLQTNGTNIPISGSTFAVTLASGTAYNVVVTTQPGSPTQTCAVGNATGTVTGANIGTVTVTCTTNTYTVSGTITGLAGTGLVLQTHGTNVPISGGTFTVTLASGTAYNVLVTTQPTSPTQTCAVAGGGPGTVTNANIGGVTVTCATNPYTVMVNVTDATASPNGLVLQDNGGDNLNVTGTGSFQFATAVASGAPYLVTALTQPSLTPAQYCLALNGSGTVTNASITVNVKCSNVGQFLFVANTYDGPDGDVSGFTIGSGSGALTAAAGSPFAADLNPTGIALAQGGHFAYVSNFGSSDISTYTVGAAAVLSLNTLNGGGTGNVGAGLNTNPVSVVTDQAGQYVYVGADVTAQIGVIVGNGIGSGTGILTAIAGPPASPFAAGNTPYGLAVDPSTAFVFATYQYQNGMAVFSIGAGGTLTNVANSPFATGDGPIGVAVYPAGGFVYTANSGAGTVSAFAYDPSSGALSELISLGSPYTAGGAPTGITIDPTGRFLYVTNYGVSTVSTFTIAPLTGQLSAVGTPVATGTGPKDIKVDPSGHFAYVANFLSNTVSVFTINPTTGALSLASTANAGTASAAIAIE
jgi:6-phosphogluconolactonase (cycloisomerase 2 family)